jgi:hypothetical protein
MTEVLEPHLSQAETVREVFTRTDDEGNEEQVIAITDKRLLGWERDEREETSEPAVETVDAIPLENVGATQIRRVERQPIRWEWIFLGGIWAIAGLIIFAAGGVLAQDFGAISKRFVDVISVVFLLLGVAFAGYAFVRDEGYVKLSVSSPGTGVSTAFEFPDDEYEFAAKVNEAIAEVVS